MATEINSSIASQLVIIVVAFHFLFILNGDAKFTKFPPNVSYVVNGGNASFEWDYVIDSGQKLTMQSPTWQFYDNGQQSIICYKNRLNKDAFTISRSCPQRLKNRVAYEPRAVLTIKNVTGYDDGVYGCSLVFGSNHPIETKKTTLVVTTLPNFSVKPNPRTAVVENEELMVPCEALGPPTPKVKWVNVSSGQAVVEKIGSAILSVGTIQRDHQGKQYRCEANNNPNELPISVTTTVEVYYPPEVDKDFVIIPYCIGDKVNLTKYVKIGGNPTPNVTCSHKGKSTTLVFQVSKDDQYGNYSCRATNMLNNVVFTVQLIKRNTSCQTTPAPPVTPAPGTDDDDVHPGIIAGVVLAVILAIIGVIIAIIFWRRRKAYKQDTGTPKNQTVRMNDVQDNEEFYATAQHNRDSPTEEQPQVQYAKVDKSKKTKKKIPGQGELIYADLDHEGPENNRPSTLRRPTDSNDQGTLYADIHSAQQEVPRYGNLDNM